MTRLLIYYVKYNNNIYYTLTPNKVFERQTNDKKDTKGLMCLSITYEKQFVA